LLYDNQTFAIGAAFRQHIAECFHGFSPWICRFSAKGLTNLTQQPMRFFDQSNVNQATTRQASDMAELHQPDEHGSQNKSFFLVITQSGKL
jgi:hypothetical protein